MAFGWVCLWAACDPNLTKLQPCRHPLLPSQERSVNDRRGQSLPAWQNLPGLAPVSTPGPPPCLLLHYLDEGSPTGSDSALQRILAKSGCIGCPDRKEQRVLLASIGWGPGMLLHSAQDSPPWRMCAVTQSCPTLCNPMNCSPPGSSAHGIFQVRILEWIAFPFSRGSSQPRDQTWVSPGLQADSLPSEPPRKPIVYDPARNVSSAKGQRPGLGPCLGTDGCWVRRLGLCASYPYHIPPVLAAAPLGLPHITQGKSPRLLGSSTHIASITKPQRHFSNLPPGPPISLPSASTWLPSFTWATCTWVSRLLTWSLTLCSSQE